MNLETDFPHERFHEGAALFVKRSSGAVDTLTIETVRFQHERPVIGFAGVADMNEASALAGLELRVPLAELVSLPPGTFYRHDLIDCVVATPDGTRVGVVTAVEGEIGGSRLVVTAERGEILVPLVAEICRLIDPAGKRIVIAPPDGLLDLNERRA